MPDHCHCQTRCSVADRAASPHQTWDWSQAAPDAPGLHCRVLLFTALSETRAWPDHGARCQLGVKRCHLVTRGCWWVINGLALLRKALAHLSIERLITITVVVVVVCFIVVTVVNVVPDSSPYIVW